MSKEHTLLRQKIEPRKGLRFMPIPKEATPIVAACVVTKKTRWLRRKYQVLHIVTKDAVYEVLS